MSYGTSSKKAKHHRSVSTEATSSALIKHAGISAALSLGCAAVALLLGSALCFLSDDPGGLALPIGLAALFVSAMIGGLLSARMHPDASVPCGALCGLLFCAFLWILSLWIKSDSPTVSLPISLLLRGGTIGASVIGAFLGRRRQRRPSRRRH